MLILNLIKFLLKLPISHLFSRLDAIEAYEVGIILLKQKLRCTWLFGTIVYIQLEKGFSIGQNRSGSDWCIRLISYFPFSFFSLLFFLICCQTKENQHRKSARNFFNTCQVLARTCLQFFFDLGAAKNLRSIQNKKIKKPQISFTSTTKNVQTI